jgi:hypothetical protein
MKKILPLLLFIISCKEVNAQKPCSKPAFRQFDFWIGEWDVFGKKGNKAGDSKITVLLDSCVILEEWTSAGTQQGLVYSGKSFNSYNAATKQWQQTWTDNTGNTTEYLRGEGVSGKIIYYADKVAGSNGKEFMRRLTFSKLTDNKVRQFGERSDDGGITWAAEYDLEYRRKEQNPVAIADTLLKKMMLAYNQGQFEKIAACYTSTGKIIGSNTEISGTKSIINYWQGFASLGGTWQLTTEKTERTGDEIWQKGISVITDKNNKTHKVSFTLMLIQENNEWKILQDAFW